MAPVVANKTFTVKQGPLYLTLVLLFASYSVRAEDVLARRLSVTFRETPLKQALDEVSKLADFEWSYNASLIDANRRVSLSARDWTVREILHEMLGDNYAFKSSGKYLILKKQRPSKSELSGVVRDPKTGDRLANVTIYDRKTLRATTTDSSGYYRLRVKKSAEIVVARLGYRDTVLRVSSMTPRYQKIELSQVPAPTSDSSSLAYKLKSSLQKTASELDYFFNTTFNKWHDINVPDTLRRRFQMSLLPKIGTNHVLSGKVENDFSINILAGQSAGVRGVELAGLGNFTGKEVKGFQAAGLFNVNRGDCHGVQMAGLYNKTASTLDGAQFAGLVNVAQQSAATFIQASGLVNIMRKNSASTADTAAAKGIQAAGLVNKADQLDGLQLAGLVNNVHNMEGIQASGLVNRAKRLRGVQFGLINHADELHGVQIGLINRVGRRWMPVVNWRR
jgi:hypothetical protein